jgi:hypothetical protein
MRFIMTLLLMFWSFTAAHAKKVNGPLGIVCDTSERFAKYHRVYIVGQKPYPAKTKEHTGTKVKNIVKHTTLPGYLIVLVKNGKETSLYCPKLITQNKCHFPQRKPKKKDTISTSKPPPPWHKAKQYLKKNTVCHIS